MSADKTDQDDLMVVMNAAELGAELLAIFTDEPIPEGQTLMDYLAPMTDEQRHTIGAVGMHAINWVMARVGYQLADTPLGRVQ